MMEEIRIGLVDDHPVVREGLASILETQSDFKIVAQANNGKEALSFLKKEIIDVLFVDLNMPEMSGLELLHAINKLAIKTKIIVFTVYDTEDQIFPALEAGAKGYLLKGSAKEEIFTAIRVVHAGGTLLEPMIVSKLVSNINNPITPLTKREHEVIQEMAKGCTNKQIAEVLFISERTVKFHVSSILSKLHANNRTEAVQIAIQTKIVNVG